MWPDERWKIALKLLKIPHLRSTVRNWDVETVRAFVARSTIPNQNVQNNPFSDQDVETVHAVVARSTFTSQNVQNRPFADSPCRCGTKHIFKSKCTRHTILGRLLEVEMLKKCASLWQEAHLQVKMLKTTTSSDHFWKFRYGSAWPARRSPHLAKSERKGNGF